MDILKSFYGLPPGQPLLYPAYKGGYGTDHERGKPFMQACALFAAAKMRGRPKGPFP